MTECAICGTHSDLPYKCRYCSKSFCSSHQLPENHNCPYVRQENAVKSNLGPDLTTDTPTSVEDYEIIERAPPKSEVDSKPSFLLAVLSVGFILAAGGFILWQFL